MPDLSIKVYKFLFWHKGLANPFWFSLPVRNDAVSVHVLRTDSAAVDVSFQPAPYLGKLGGHQPLVQPCFEGFVWDVFNFDIDC